VVATTTATATSERDNIELRISSLLSVGQAGVLGCEGLHGSAPFSTTGASRADTLSQAFRLAARIPPDAATYGCGTAPESDRLPLPGRVLVAAPIESHGPGGSNASRRALGGRRRRLATKSKPSPGGILAVPDIAFPYQVPTFDDVEAERTYLKQRLAAAY